MKDKKAIVRSKLINGLARARNKEKFWVPRHKSNPSPPKHREGGSSIHWATRTHEEHGYLNSLYVTWRSCWRGNNITRYQLRTPCLIWPNEDQGTNLEFLLKGTLRGLLICQLQQEFHLGLQKHTPCLCQCFVDSLLPIVPFPLPSR